MTVGLACAVALAAGQLDADGRELSGNTATVSTTQTFRPVADARVEEANPDANFGSFRRLATDRDYGAERRSYLRFEVSDLDGLVTSAKLRLYAEGTSADGPELWPVVNNWEEGSVTWNTRPAAVGRPAGDQGAIPAYSWIEYDVTALVSGDGTYSFRLSQYSHDGLTFASREAASGQPELVLETARETERTVFPAGETDPVPHSGDAADDPAIWVNPSDPSRSTIIGTDKLGGIAVYDLAGTQLQYRDETARYNNVDLRAGFPLGEGSAPLVAVSDRRRYYTTEDRTEYYQRIAFYSVDPATGTLAGLVGTVRVDYEPYGLCMYHSRQSGEFYVFVTSRDETGPVVEQWRISGSATGQIDAHRVRSFSLGSQAEGCVTDDGLGHLYIAEEDQGIWKFPAEPGEGVDRVLVDATAPEGNLVADVEGLGIAYGPEGTGHLLASSQGDSSYTVYRRGGSNAYLRTVWLGDGDQIDGVTDTDGIDVTSAGLGPAFPGGLFVAQDGTNTTPEGTPANQNYKLVPLQEILEP
ncbi:MAG: 3-phytase [uncultured Rubrobacteraceae bacterium]|uniref:3-phytase n=1 Tax=uncultured Rubrobacteraceae bacterium TaxID=349277 RepID=A0A6J4QD63_9ACTN|nr:MAG: 3-phytase [uncultured Rubrobacteraceae bacterium]